MRSITVLFDNGQIIKTDINGTPNEIAAYYMAGAMNIGSGEQDLMADVVSVEFDGERLKTFKVGREGGSLYTLTICHNGAWYARNGDLITADELPDAFIFGWAERITELAKQCDFKTCFKLN